MVTVTTKPVVLMGFMGSGKSTLGNQLALLLNLEFIDLDHRIEASAGLSIPEIFDRLGEKKFREIESLILRQVLDGDQTIIAAGGGTPCNHLNISLIKEMSFSVYLKVSISELLDRLGSSPTPRPLLNGKNRDETREFIETLLTEREFYYNQANTILQSDSITLSLLHDSLSH